MRYLFALLAFTNPAWAACESGEETFVSCQIENSSKTLAVCFTDTTAFYRFGTAGAAPDLELIEPIATVDYLPWPGVGRSIWEAVTFRVDGYSYETFGGFERMFGDEEYEDVPHRKFGGVHVSQDETTIVDLSCERSTVEFVWGEGLFTAKQNLGLTWDFDTRSWIELPD